MGESRKLVNSKNSAEQERRHVLKSGHTERNAKYDQSHQWPTVKSVTAKAAVAMPVAPRLGPKVSESSGFVHDCLLITMTSHSYIDRSSVTLRHQRCYLCKSKDDSLSDHLCRFVCFSF